MARLGDHPNIVTVHDVIEESGAIHIVTQHMAGGDLARRIATAPERPARDRRGGGDRDPDLPRARARACARRHPPRPQARQRVAVVRRHRQAGRLRARARARPLPAHRGRHDRRHRRLHAARAGARAVRATRAPISTRWARRSTRWSPAGRRSPATTWWRCCRSTSTPRRWRRVGGTPRCRSRSSASILELLAKDPEARPASAAVGARPPASRDGDHRHSGGGSDGSRRQPARSPGRRRVRRPIVGSRAPARRVRGHPVGEVPAAPFVGRARHRQDPHRGRAHHLRPHARRRRAVGPLPRGRRARRRSGRGCRWCGRGSRTASRASCWPTSVPALLTSPRWCPRSTTCCRDSRRRLASTPSRLASVCSRASR